MRRFRVIRDSCDIYVTGQHLLAFLFLLSIFRFLLETFSLCAISVGVRRVVLETSVGRSRLGRTALCRTPGTGHPAGRVDQLTIGSRAGRVQAGFDRHWTKSLYNPPYSRARD